MKKRIALTLSMIIPLFLSGCGGIIATKSISSTEEFIEFLNNSKSDVAYKLKCDVDFGGQMYTSHFNKKNSIKLDCGGHAISNLLISSTESASIFGTLKNSEIKNATFKNITIIGDKPGLLATTSSGNVFKNLIIASDVTIGDGSSDYAGGLVSSSSNDEFESCENNGVIKGKDYCGGLAASSGSTMVRCVNRGKVFSYGKSNVGGLAGSFTGHSPTIEFKENANYGDIINPSINNVGGLVGYAKADGHTNDLTYIIQNCTNYGKIEGNENVGGISGNSSGIYTTWNMGTVWATSYLKYAFNSNKGTVIANERAGGITGNVTNRVTFEHCSNDYNDERDNYVGAAYDAGGIAGMGYYFNNCENNGKVTVLDRNIEIPSSYPSLMNGKGNIGGICGRSFYGNDGNYTLCSNNGLVTGVASSETSNKYTLGRNIGGICGVGFGSFLNCSNNGTINGERQLGGIIGLLTPVYETRISTCTSRGILNCGSYNLGGIVGVIYSILNYPYQSTNTTKANKTVTITQCQSSIEKMIYWSTSINTVGGLIGAAKVEDLGTTCYGIGTIISSSCNSTVYTYFDSVAAVIASNDSATISGVDTSVVNSIDSSTVSNCSVTRRPLPEAFTE